jgi:D-alanyl-D-alanine endopeptidase (penicillin-binding protein 7)
MFFAGLVALVAAASTQVLAAGSGATQGKTRTKLVVQQDKAKAKAKAVTTTRAAKRGAPVAKPQPQKGKLASAKTLSRQQRLLAKREAQQRAAAAAAMRELNHYAVDDEGNPMLRSAAVVVQDQSSGTVLFEKNSEAVLSIASITKLMTAMVVLDGHQGLSELLTIGEEDMDYLRGTRSRLGVGTQLTREDMLRLALMSSENRAAASLARHYPGGSAAFIEAMNRKARELGLSETRFYDSTGLNAANVSSARDLCKMVAAAAKYPLVREFSTTTDYTVELNGRLRTFHNTNALVRSPDWEIGVSKTGFIHEAGRCLVMQAWVNQKPMIIVLLDSWGKLTRLGDANRIKRWIESATASARQSS